MADEAPIDVQIEAHADFVEARLWGVFAVDRFNRQVDTAVGACLERKLSLLLVDITGIQAALTTVDRYEISSHGAHSAAGLKVAVFAPPDLVDPKKFGVLVARNRGLKVDIFTDREKALAWLLAPR